MYARARALDREADAALFYGRATAAERLSNQAAELRDVCPMSPLSLTELSDPAALGRLAQ